MMQLQRKVKVERHVKETDPNIRYIENTLTEKLDAKVKIRDNKIVIIKSSRFREAKENPSIENFNYRIY